MTKEEQIFKELFPEYCRGEVCLSPYFDLFQIGFEEGEKAGLKKGQMSALDYSLILYSCNNKEELKEVVDKIREEINHG